MKYIIQTDKQFLCEGNKPMLYFRQAVGIGLFKIFRIFTYHLNTNIPIKYSEEGYPIFQYSFVSHT